MSYPINVYLVPESTITLTDLPLCAKWGIKFLTNTTNLKNNVFLLIIIFCFIALITLDIHISCTPCPFFLFTSGNNVLFDCIFYRLIEQDLSDVKCHAKPQLNIHIIFANSPFRSWAHQTPLRFGFTTIEGNCLISHLELYNKLFDSSRHTVKVFCNFHC